MFEVSEEEVKYLVDKIKEEQENLVSFDTSNTQADTISETLQGLKAIWSTIGGIAKIEKASSQTEELDTSKLATAANSLSSLDVSYTKEIVTKSIELKPKK